MSVTTDRMLVAAKAARAVANAAVAEADEAQRVYEAEMALEQAEADRLAALEADAAPAPTPADVPPATPAAVAHADATGVDLTQVEGTGVDGTILKADVVAAAADVNAPEAAA